MGNLFEKFTLTIGAESETPFHNNIGVYQDGTTPMYRDIDGKLWAMSGHSHKGYIAMFCGTSLDDMKHMYRISTNFCVGHAEYAFSGIRYPEGVLPRGSIWPFGLYICPNTHRFFCFFHNETGWNGKGTAYHALGPCDKPHYDSDFRHIGLMHSDDEGKNWTFDRWVLTAETVCFTELYNPGAGKALGQKAGLVSLGSGDFSLYVEPDGEYMYIFYNIIYVDTNESKWKRCDTYVARTRKRTDGIMGDFVKYYNGEFCEAGNLGKETAIIENTWHTRVTRLEKYDCFICVSSPINFGNNTKLVADYMEIRTSKDMIHWSEPVTVEYEGKIFGNHYMAAISDDIDRQPNVVKGDQFSILTNHNGTNVMRYSAIIK
jgi:hypothetical protein